MDCSIPRGIMDAECSPPLHTKIKLQYMDAIAWRNFPFPSAPAARRRTALEMGLLYWSGGGWILHKPTDRLRGPVLSTHPGNISFTIFFFFLSVWFLLLLINDPLSAKHCTEAHYSTVPRQSFHTQKPRKLLLMGERFPRKLCSAIQFVCLCLRVFCRNLSYGKDHRVGRVAFAKGSTACWYGVF